MSKAQVVILAGGIGSRLRPYTTVLPKPLMPLSDLPIAEVIIRQLKYYNLINIVISTGHLSGLIETYFGNGKKWGVHIKYVYENKPLGTAGAIKLIKNTEENFLVINGDILTNMNFSKLLAYHKKLKSPATIAVKERTIKNEFGVIEVNDKKELVDYVEKPEYKSYVSIGVNVLNRRCKDFIPDHKHFGVPELMLKLKNSGQKVGCYPVKDIWLDLGRLDDFDAAQEIFEKNRKKFLLT